MHTTSSIEAKEVRTSPGTASPSAERVTTGFMRRAGGRGVLDSTRSLGALLWAMAKHPFGSHDYVDELDYSTNEDGMFTVIGVTSTCWLCEARTFST